MTQKLVDSNYFDFAGQYDVGHASFDGSDTAGGILNPCSSNPGSTTNFLDILSFIECETSLAPTGVPSPTAGPFGGNDLYVVYLPVGTTIDNFGINHSCDGFGAYHFMGVTVTLLGGAQVTFAAIPLDCANGDPDQLSELVSHEVDRGGDRSECRDGLDRQLEVRPHEPHAALHGGRGRGHLLGRRRRADRPRSARQRDHGRHVLVERRQRVRSVPDGGPRGHEDATAPIPRSRASSSTTRSPSRTTGRTTCPTSRHGHAAFAGRVRDRRPRDLHRGTDGHAHLQLRQGAERRDARPSSSRSHVKAERRVECRPPDRDHQLGRGRERQGAGSRTPTNNSASASTIVEDRADLARDEALQARRADARRRRRDVHDLRRQPRSVRCAQRQVVTDTHVSNGSFTILGASASPGGACPAAGGVVTCDLGTEPAGGRTTIIVTETATEAQDVNDCASVSSATPDPNHGEQRGVRRRQHPRRLRSEPHQDGRARSARRGHGHHVHAARCTTRARRRRRTSSIRDLLPSSVTVVSVTQRGRDVRARRAGRPGVIRRVARTARSRPRRRER